MYFCVNRLDGSGIICLYSILNKLHYFLMLKFQKNQNIFDKQEQQQLFLLLGRILTQQKKIISSSRHPPFEEPQCGGRDFPRRLLSLTSIRGSSFFSSLVYPFPLIATVTSSTICLRSLTLNEGPWWLLYLRLVQPKVNLKQCELCEEEVSGRVRFLGELQEPTNIFHLVSSYPNPKVVAHGCICYHLACRSGSQS